MLDASNDEPMMLAGVAVLVTLLVVFGLFFLCAVSIIRHFRGRTNR